MDVETMEIFEKNNVKLITKFRLITNTAEEFQKVQQAYEILNDDKLRATYDDLQRVRELRLRKEITQCDKKLEERLNSETRDESYRMLGRRPTIVDHNGELNVRLGDYVRSFRFASDISSEDDTTIKASWICKEGERDYSEIQLKEIFKEYGEVIEAVKSRRKSFAIIVMGSKDASVNYSFSQADIIL